MRTYCVQNYLCNVHFILELQWTGGHFVIFLLKSGILKLQRRALDKLENGEWRLSTTIISDELSFQLLSCKLDRINEYLIVSETEQMLLFEQKKTSRSLSTYPAIFSIIHLSLLPHFVPSLWITSFTFTQKNLTSYNFLWCLLYFFS